MADDRRRSARVEILGRVSGQAVSLDTAVVVRDISLFGMAIETPFAFPVGAIHDFRLTLGDGAHVLLHAQARHCRLIRGTGDVATYLTGFRFVADEAPENSSPVGDLLKRM